MPATLAQGLRRTTGPNAAGTYAYYPSGVVTAYPGDVIVMKCVSQGPTNTIPDSPGIQSPTTQPGTALVWTLRASCTAATACQGRIWTTTIPNDWPATGTALQPKCSITSPGGTNMGYFYQIIERWTDAAMASSPVVVQDGTTTPAAGRMTASMTPSQVGSALTWTAADYAGVSTAAGVAASGNVLIDQWQTGGGILAAYIGRQAITSISAKTIGMASPTGQRDSILAVEILESTARSGRGNAGTLALDARGTRSNPQTQHKMDYTQADVVAAGALDDSWQRQNASGTFNDNTVPWPMVVTTSPTGRTQRSAKVTIPNNYRRYEFVPNHRRFYPGDDVWFGNAFFIDAGGLSVNASGYQVIEQLRQSTSIGSPGMAVEVLGGELCLTGGWGIDQANPTRLQWYQTLLSTVQTGRWYEYFYRMRFSDQENTSVLDFWVDGVQLLAGKVLKPPTVVEEGTYRKLGLYHDASNPGGTVYHSGTAMGLSQAYVDPSEYKKAVGNGNPGTLALDARATGKAHQVTQVDSYTVRLQNDVNIFQSWLGLVPGSRGWVGEFGFVTNLPADRAKYDAAAEYYLSLLDYYGIRWSQWAAGRNWGTGYPLGSYVSSVVGGAIDTAQAGLTGVMESHAPIAGGFSVNLSGLENGVQYSGGGSPRTATLYTPNSADMAALAGRGVRVIRLPITWERLQPALMGALDSTYLGVLDGVLSAARAVGIGVLLDLHNYARYTAVDGSVYAMVEAGSNLNIGHLVDVWTRLVQWLQASTPRWNTVQVYGIMNEPHDLAPSGTRSPQQVWEYACQQVVNAIRGLSDTTPIAVPTYGTSQIARVGDWHPAGPWITNGGALYYEVHHYADYVSALGANSGTFQQNRADGQGVEIERYQTELDAAVAWRIPIAPNFGSLVEDWSQGIRRAAGQPWAQSYDGGGGNPALATLTLGDQTIVGVVSAIAGNQYSGFRTDYAFRLNPGRIRVRVPKVLALNGGASVETRIIIDGVAPNPAAGTRLVLTHKAQTNTIEFRNEAGYWEANPVSIAYVPANHLWWGIRGDDTNIYFETSADGFTWQTQRTITAPDWTKLAACRLTMEATRDTGTVDTAQFGPVNLTLGVRKSGYGQAPASGFTWIIRGAGSQSTRVGSGRAPATMSYNQRGYGSQSTRAGAGRAPATMVYDQKGVRAGIAKGGNGRCTGWTDLQRATGSKVIVGSVVRASDLTLPLVNPRGTGMQVRPGFGNAGVLPLGVIRGLGQPRKTGAGLAPALAWGNTWGRGSYSTRTGGGRVPPLVLLAQSGAAGRLASGYGAAPASGFSWGQRGTGLKQISMRNRQTDATLTLTTRATGSAARTGGGRAPAPAWNVRGFWAAQARVGQATAYGLQNYGRSYGPKTIFGRGRAPAPAWPDGRGTGIQIRPGFGAAYGLNLRADGRRPPEIPDYFPVTRPVIVWPFQQEDIRIVAQHVRTREYLHTFVPLHDAKLKIKLSGATEITGSIKPEVQSLKGRDGRPVFKDWSTLLHFEIQGEIWGSGILQPIETSGDSISITALGVSAYPDDIPYLANWSRVNIDAFDVLAEGWRYVQSFPNSNLGVKPVRTYLRLPNRLGLEPKEMIEDGIQYDDAGNMLPADMTIEHYAPGKNEPTWLFLMNVEGWPWKWEGDPPVGAMDVPKAIKANADKGVLSDRATGYPRWMTINRSDVSQNVWDSLVYLGYAAVDGKTTTVRDNVRVSVLREQFKPWELKEHEGNMVGGKIAETLTSAKLDFLETSMYTDDDRTDTVQNVVPVYPRIGSPRPDCRFVQGSNIISVVDPSQQDDWGASAMWGVGNGEGVRAVRRTIEGYDDGDRLRRVAIYKNARIKDSGELDKQLRVQLQARRETLEIPSITVKLFHPNARLGDYWVGDDIFVEAETRWWGDVKLWHRIMEIEIDARRQLATLTLRRSDSFLYGQWAESDTAEGVGGTIGDTTPTGTSLGGGPVQQPAPPVGGKDANLAWAAAEVRDWLRKGGKIYEDYTFPGCSANLKKYNDKFAAEYSIRDGSGWTRDGILAYLQRIINANL